MNRRHCQHDQVAGRESQSVLVSSGRIRRRHRPEIGPRRTRRCRRCRPAPNRMIRHLQGHGRRRLCYHPRPPAALAPDCVVRPSILVLARSCADETYARHWTIGEHP